MRMLITHTEMPDVFLHFAYPQIVRLFPICGFGGARKRTVCCTDAHVGKGVSIGTVFASEKYVAPMAVGVDIGMLLSCVSTTHCPCTCHPCSQVYPYANPLWSSR